MRRLVLAAAIACAALAAAPLTAQFMPDGKWWKRPRIATAIDLSSEQSRQLDQIFARTRPKLIDLKADLEKREFEFEQAMEEGSNADRKAIAARIEAREEARAKLQKELALMVLDMRQVLRPEQWERLTRMQQVVREQNQERRRGLREQERRLERRGPLEGGPPPGAAQPPPPTRRPQR